MIVAGVERITWTGAVTDFLGCGGNVDVCGAQRRRRAVCILPSILVALL